MTLSPPWRKFVLLLHITSSVGFMGAVAGFVALAVAGLTSGTSPLALAVYPAMRVVTWDVIVPLAVASVMIGVVQSLGTPWGLFRYYWVIIKLALSLVALGVLLLQLETVDMLATMAAAGGLDGMTGARFSMALHGTGGLLVLLAANVLSVYKPRGVTRYGASRMA